MYESVLGKHSESSGFLALLCDILNLFLVLKSIILISEFRGEEKEAAHFLF